jgi:hypothetical protein
MKKDLLLIGISAYLFSASLHAELIQQFKSPSFSGQGWSSHTLTIETIEKNRRDAIEAQKKSDQAAELSAQQNTPLNRFLNLFQSQVYAQLATQLSNNLFQNNCKTDQGVIPGCVNPTTGSFKLDDNTVTWTKASDTVTLTVVDKSGSVTTVKVPIASFAF